MWDRAPCESPAPSTFGGFRKCDRSRTLSMMVGLRLRLSNSSRSSGLSGRRAQIASVADELEYNADQIEAADDFSSPSPSIQTTAWKAHRDLVRRWLRPSPPLVATVTETYQMLERMSDGEKPPAPDRLRSAASRLRATLL